MNNDTRIVLELVGAILLFAFVFHVFLEWLDWKIKERRIWRNVKRRIGDWDD